jgi:Hypothetical protein (DUF2513)
MKRDLDLIREILLQIEADPKFDGSANPVDAAKLGITGRTNAEVMYQVVQLIDGGLLAGKILSAGAFPPAAVVIFKLTWKGHEYLDSVRDPAVWKETKVRLEGAGSFTFDLAKAFAKGFVKKKIEEHTGVKLEF